jgi:Glycosyl transferase family 2
MIKLLSVIGHGIDILPHFINHYEKIVDEINLVIYETEKYPLLGNQVKEIVEDNDKVKIIKIVKDRIFDWEKVTKLYNFIKNKTPHEWWVIADVDEFQLYPDDNLKKIISNCDENDWEIVRGGFIDRIGEDGDFVELDPNTSNSIWEQFPNAGFFRYPMSYACPNKICISKGHIEITSGQHYAKINGHTTWRWQGWNHPLINPIDTVQVHHFKWDKSSIDRIKDVASIKQEYAYSEEYSKMYTAILKNKFKINLTKPEYMFELGLIYPEYRRYKQWDKLFKKIISI